jgi:NitT/TauT family transport system ATP-binding protein
MTVDTTAPTTTSRAGTRKGEQGASVELRHVALHYMTVQEETEALRDISFKVEPGEFIAVVGPSGCGKSTFLSLISGLLAPSAGEVFVGGKPVSGPSRRVGYMLQQDHLFEWRTIIDNVVLGAEVRGQNRAEAKEQGLRLLERYGLGGFQDHYPQQLSGGMRQRVALIRTLTTQPDVVLLDEPFSALDFQTRLSLVDEVARILREDGKTVVLVTHDIGEAISMADRVLVMSGRPGRIKSEHTFSFSGAGLQPFEVHSHPDYPRYFTQICEELDVHVTR